MSIPPEVQAIHGISDAMVAGAPSAAEVLPEFMEFIGQDQLVGHNPAFDLGRIASELHRTGLTERYSDFAFRPAIDTARIARRAIATSEVALGQLGFPGFGAPEVGLSNYSQESLANYFGIAQPEAHRALPDTEVNREIYQRLRNTIGPEEMRRMHGRGVRAAIKQQQAGGLQLRFPFARAPYVPSEVPPSAAELGAVLENAEGRATQRIITKAAQKTSSAFWNFIEKHRLGATTATVLGAMAIEGYLFSGRDDNYNTIEGMRHGGFLGAMRPINTDFGSGYRGLWVHGQYIAPEVQQFRDEWAGKEDLLKKAIREGATTYGEFSSSELTPIAGTGKSRVDLSAYTPEWEDADTLLLRSPWWKFKKDVAVRLTGIDAPEVYHPDDPLRWIRFHQEQPHGRESVEYLKQITRDQALQVEVASDPGQRTYGRYLGLVSLAGHEDPLNLELVRAGQVAALPFGEAGSDIYPRQKFMSAEREAVSQQRGIWSLPWFQRYRQVSSALGGRITFNSLTDLSRLSTNYSLAAMESFLSREDNPANQSSTAALLGRKLIPSYGRFFSGRDDAHNTIEGLRHGGIAGSTRRENTDFGSGWRGLFGGISRRISKFLAGARREALLSPIEAAAMAHGRTAEQFAEALGERALIARGGRATELYEEWAANLPGLEGGAASLTDAAGRRLIAMNPERLRTQFYEMAIERGMAPESARAAVESEDFLNTVLYHEALEKQAATRFGALRKMPAQHEAAQVLVGEAGFAQQTGNTQVQELFARIRGARKEEETAHALGTEMFGGRVHKRMASVAADFGETLESLQAARTEQRASRHAARAVMPPPSLPSHVLDRTAPQLQQAQRVVAEAGRSGGRGHTSYTSSISAGRK